MSHTDHGDGTATLSGTPTTGDAGNHVVSLVVRDAGGLTDDQEFTVTAADEFPELGSITGQIFDDQDGDGQVDEGEGVGRRVRHHFGGRGRSPHQLSDYGRER